MKFGGNIFVDSIIDIECIINKLFKDELFKYISINKYEEYDEYRIVLHFDRLKLSIVICPERKVIGFNIDFKSCENEEEES